MDLDSVVLDSVTGEEMPASEARTCACCGAVHHKTGPIGFERGELDGYCGHWTCDDCHASAPASKWDGLKRCSACLEW